MTTEQIQKLESYFTDRFKTLLDGKIGEDDNYKWLSILNLKLIGD